MTSPGTQPVYVPPVVPAPAGQDDTLTSLLARHNLPSGCTVADLYNHLLGGLGAAYGTVHHTSWLRGQAIALHYEFASDDCCDPATDSTDCRYVRRCHECAQDWPCDTARMARRAMPCRGHTMRDCPDCGKRVFDASVGHCTSPLYAPRPEGADLACPRPKEARWPDEEQAHYVAAGTSRHDGGTWTAQPCSDHWHVLERVTEEEQ